LFQLLKAPPARTGFLKPRDFQRLLNNIAIDFRPLLVFLYYCGVRVGEAAQVQWSSVDLDKALIVLQEGETKHDEPRVIPIPDVLVRMLKNLPSKEGAVFDTGRGLRTEWERATKSCSLPGLLIHDFRRSAIRNMMLSGAQQVEAMKISGHKTASVFQRYNIVDEAQITGVMKRVERAVPIKLRNALAASGRRSMAKQGLTKSGESRPLALVSGGSLGESLVRVDRG
jgi:integrase